MNLIEELRQHFATGTQGLRPIKNLPKDYPAWTFRESQYYGVAIKIDGEVCESATNVIFYTRDIIINNQPTRFLILASSKEENREEFAALCSQAISPGENGEFRKNITDDPFGWWERWTSMLGDRKSNKKSYDVIAEMLALDFLYKDDNSIRWTAKEAGTHDIESNTKSFEVKSTLKKSETNITISSQHQLASTNPLYLVFFRMEESLSGFSINDIIQSLVAHGYNAGTLESQLESKGLIKGSSIRDVKYAILEIRKYEVNDEFPKIIEKSFKNDKFPDNIIKITYTIDLEGIKYNSIYLEQDNTRPSVYLNYNEV